MEFEAKFTRALKTLLEDEGGYRNVPTDPGGETKFGIAKASHPNLDIASLTEEDAAHIYWEEWWSKFGYGQIQNEVLALKLLSHAVNIGWMKPGQNQLTVPAPRAHVFLQLACNQVIAYGYGTAGQLLRADGQMGPLTYETVNALDPCLVLLRFLAQVHLHYKKCAIAQPSELPGWEVRLFSCL